MHRYHAPLSGPETFFAVRSWAGCIINTSGFDLRRGQPAYTPHTITAREEFDGELDIIEQQGFSPDREEFLLRMAATAVPVTGKDGAVIAAVACHAPSIRFNIEQAKTQLPQIREAARKLAETLAR